LKYPKANFSGKGTGCFAAEGGSRWDERGGQEEMWAGHALWKNRFFKAWPPMVLHGFFYSSA
jgi:hypothetical protein